MNSFKSKTCYVPVLSQRCQFYLKKKIKKIKDNFKNVLQENNFPEPKAVIGLRTTQCLPILTPKVHLFRKPF